MYSGTCDTKVYQKADGQSACGMFLANDLTWGQANDKCIGLGGRLPVITTAKENADIYNLLPVQ